MWHKNLILNINDIVAMIGSEKIHSQAATAGLYIHIPFCLRKCAYCDFYSIDDLTRLPAFMDALMAEMALIKNMPFHFDTIYIGGGTPSLLAPGQVSWIIRAARCYFDISDDPEITLEVNPGTVTTETLARFRSAGVNRLNIGIQSFDDENLRFLGRIHSAKEGKTAIGAARDAGFDNLGLDLIHCLPNQSAADWKADLNQAADFQPEHLSCYLLTWEEGTLLHRRWQAGQCEPPLESRATELFYLTGDVLAGRGFHQYEISNFARSASLQSRHNQKYWTLAPYIGLGPSAHSFDPVRSIRLWNHRNLEKYLTDIADGRLPAAGQETLDQDQQMMEVIYLGLRMAAGIDLADFKQRFRMDFCERFGQTAKALAAEGLLIISPDRCRPTCQGMAVADGMAVKFCNHI